MQTGITIATILVYPSTPDTAFGRVAVRWPSAYLCYAASSM
jgi:hypothetical protein